jgi:hypothetical protein
MMPRAGAVAIGLVFSLALTPLAPAWGQDDRLEEWQERILRALEEAEDDEAEEDEGRRGARGRQSYSRQPGNDAGAARAAEQARRQYGGQALAVVRVGDVYRVRLLLDNGRVTTVTIED